LLQLLLALATTVQSVAGWQPWRWLQRRLQQQPPGAALMQLQPVLMARAAHTGGTLFAVTGLLTLLVLLVIQDLAFGWSTTLNTAAQSYHGDRKSTRLNSSHVKISYAVFCLKK